MPECVTSTCRLFADDSLVYRRIKTPADALLLQQDLKELEAWDNPDKLEVLRIRNKRNPIVTNYIIHGKELETVNSAKYLGVPITSKLSWNNHVSNISKKANSTLAFLQRNTTRCPRHVKAMCYNTFIRPSLEYSSAVWSPYTKNNIECLEKVQRRAARYAFGDWRRTSSVSKMQAELNWPTLPTRRQTNSLAMM